MCGFFGLRSGSGFSWGASLGFRVGLLLLLFSFYCLSFCFVSLDLRLPKLGPPNRPTKKRKTERREEELSRFLFSGFLAPFSGTLQFRGLSFSTKSVRIQWRSSPLFCLYAFSRREDFKTSRLHQSPARSLCRFPFRQTYSTHLRFTRIYASKSKNKHPPKQGRNIVNLKNIKNDTDYNSSEKR